MTSAALEEAIQADQRDAYLKLGPIPAATPINLLANLDRGCWDVLTLIPRIRADPAGIHDQQLDHQAAKNVFANFVPKLIKANKCPDFVEDKGHYFGTDLPANKRALIEYVKTL